MLRLLTTLLCVLAVLLALDPLISRLLAVRAPERSDRERVDTFANVVFRSFEEANRSVNASVSRAHRRYEALPDEKPPDEIRVFLIGNSAALFSLAPQELSRRLAGAHPGRRVRVVPLLIPDLGVVDEHLLVQAALAKQADLVVLLPNLKGLILGREPRMRFLRALFDDGSQEGVAWLERPGDALRRWLVRHWQLYRYRDELREMALDVVPSLSSRERERASIERAFDAIAEAARRGDVGALLRIYRERGMKAFVPAGLPHGKVPPEAPVFQVMRRTAEAVRVSGAMGVAIFLPVNPLFRDPDATRAHPEVRVHDPTLRRLARVSLTLYRRAGFATSDQLDALPPKAFIDLVHANASGMRAFTERAASVLIRAIQALERRERRPLGHGAGPAA